MVLVASIGAGLLLNSPAVGGQAGIVAAGSDAELTARLVAANGGEPLTFDQDEAAQLGYRNVFVDDNLPTCPDSVAFDGYESSEALATAVKVADSRGDCVLADPEFHFVIGGNPPTSNHVTEPYHHNGQQTSPNYRGGKGNFLVKDISNLSHQPDAGQQFVVDRILVKKETQQSGSQCYTPTGKWAEAGWAEHAWEVNERRIYTWSTDDCAWRWYDDFTLTDGNYYAFRVKHVNAGDLRTAVLWNDKWTVLTDYPGPDCVGPNGNSKCATEAYVEIFTAVDGNHPSWSGKIHDDDLSLFRDGGNWGAWVGSDPTAIGEVRPYTRCSEGSLSHFSVVAAGGSC